MIDDVLRETARRWAEQDPDPETQAEIRKLLEADDPELAERFAGPLVFGTAGLRGILGAGESRMNRAVVRRTSAGLAAYLLAAVPDAAERGVVVGYDARRQSDVFAEETARALAAAGIAVHLSETRCPTPVVAFAVRELGAAAGVMVTASHNPPEYNGYKVYADNGAQIIPPVDGAIAAAIAAAPGASAIPLAEPDDPRIRRFGEPLLRAYLDRCLALVGEGPGRDLAIAYTALHGVGQQLVTRVFGDAGFTGLHPVPEQGEPDGRFPTVRFPNPEEPGAMDLVLAKAKATDAALVLANDPDADRLAAAVRTAPGDYRLLTGNELGVLLGAIALERAAAERPLLVTTIVSSPMLGKLAADRGVRFAQTLTGFKWIENRALELEASEGVTLVFGYEEALGYAVGQAVRDKDGISAALVLAAAAAELHTRGETLLHELERLERRHGLFASGQRSLHFPGADGPATMARLMEGLRDAAPTSMAGLPVLATTDVKRGERRDAKGAVTTIELPTSDVVILELEGGHRVLARPSGTEPKVKIYADAREPVAEGEPNADARGRAQARVEALLEAMAALLR